ncbi:MAG: ABC transporter ATP-binding protein, partial [Bacteroidetes bacterium]|nr:ABC transporter ATP-binding protein [Bacteroidota bacterium]
MPPAADRSDMFRLENVTKRFGDTLAVDDLSVTTAPGQTTVLIG